MKTDFLQNFKVNDQPLPKEVIDAILAENGRDIEAAKKLWNEDRKSVRVVSMPSVERFLAQKCTYREFVVPEYMTKRVIVEAGTRFGWDRFRLDFKTTQFVTKDDFGASAPYKVLAEKFGFTVDNVYAKAREML